MKVSFNWSIGTGGSGPSFFLTRLAHAMKEQGVEITGDSESHVHFVFISENPKKIRRLQRRGKKVIQRLDNIYFDTGNTIGDTNRLNEPIRQTYLQVDAAVFQAEYASKMVVKRWGVKPLSKVIYNGISIDPSPAKGDGNLVVCSSKWRRHKRLKEILDVFSQLDDSFRLRILGDPDEPIDGLERVEAGQVPSFEAVKDIYRQAAVFLHLSWLDCCPNSVVEALSMGIPVVCGNQGGTPELVEMTGGGFVAPTDVAFDYEDTSLYDPPPIGGIDEIVAYINARNFPVVDTAPIDIRTTAKNYIDFAQQVLG